MILSVGSPVGIEAPPLRSEKPDQMNRTTERLNMIGPAVLDMTTGRKLSGTNHRAAKPRTIVANKSRGGWNATSALSGRSVFISSDLFKL
jgi:hypothetical protein